MRRPYRLCFLYASRNENLDYGALACLRRARIARRLKLHRSTAFRVVMSLEAAGLMQVQKRRMYQIHSVGRLKALEQEGKR